MTSIRDAVKRKLVRGLILWVPVFVPAGVKDIASSKRTYVADTAELWEKALPRYFAFPYEVDGREQEIDRIARFYGEKYFFTKKAAEFAARVNYERYQRQYEKTGVVPCNNWFVEGPITTAYYYRRFRYKNKPVEQILEHIISEEDYPKMHELQYPDVLWDIGYCFSVPICWGTSFGFSPSFGELDFALSSVYVPKITPKFHRKHNYICSAFIK